MSTILEKNKKNIFYLLAIFIAAIPVLLPLFKPGFFLSDDGEWMIIRFSAFFQSFRDGQFPVRFLERLNYGYGYPVANFLYPGFMYLGVPIHIVGFSFIETIKILFGLSLVSSGWFAYLWLAKLFRNFSAFVGSLFYIYTPYHLYDLYTRGSLGEMVALSVVPFIFWQLERRSIFWGALGIALLILSHNTMALFFLPLIAVYPFVSFKKQKYKEIFLFMLTCISLGLGIATFFWLPATVELQYTKFSTIQVSDISHYFASIELIGISTFFVLGLILSLIRKKVSPELKNLHVFFIIFVLLSVFFSLPNSKLLWDMLPSSYVQFPFRVLSYLLLGMSFLAAYGIAHFERLRKIPVVVVLCGVLLYSAMPYMKPAALFNKPDTFYSTNEDTTTVKNEYTPVWVKEEARAHYSNKIEIITGDATISNIIHNTRRLSFTASVKGNSLIQVNTIYYPGWKAYVDNTEVPIDYSNPKGVMAIALGDGEHAVAISFQETPLRLFADVISLLSFAILLFITKSRFTYSLKALQNRKT